ncbi:hypothetical protein [Metabacillus sp. 84]|uniref:hypothetical protein n=1 Tax=Metabacillus sp. 84 TaxID=3404705 RepID=UPI003CF0A69B
MSRYKLLPLVDALLGRVFRNDYNENMTKLGKDMDEIESKSNLAESTATKALSTSSSSEIKSDEAVLKADSVQAQLNQIVVEGDSSVEAAQARVGIDGETYSTLKTRIDAENRDAADKIAVLNDKQVSKDGGTYFSTSGDSNYFVLPADGSYLKFFRPPLAQGLGLKPTAGTSKPAKFCVMPNFQAIGATGAVGGLFKIFASDFEASQVQYQDMGMYYMFDQMNDKGVHNTGQFIINIKAGFGSAYENTLADLAFTAQDGNVKFGKIVYENPASGGKWGFLYIGSSQPTIAQGSSGALGIESTRGIAIKNTDRLFNGYRIYGYGNDTDYARISMGSSGAQLEIEKKAGSTTDSAILLQKSTVQVKYAQLEVDKGVISKGRTDAQTASSVDTLGNSRLVLSTIGNIDTIVGADGQQLFLLNGTTGAITLKHGTGNIFFEGATDLTLNQYGGVWLINVNNKWYKSK